MTYEFALAAAWPSVAAVARRQLAGFRLSPETVEDLIQEAATVVLRKRPDFETARDLAPYVRVVVRRLALHWLRDHRRESIGPVPDRPVLHAVPDVVEGRMRLTGTMHAFSTLQPGQRALLSDYIAERTSERAADRDHARRTSAKERKQVQRLRMAMARVADGFAAALGWLRLRFPWLDALPAHAIAIGFALSALVGAFTQPSHGSGHGDTTSVSAADGRFQPVDLPVTGNPGREAPPAGAPGDGRADHAEAPPSSRPTPGAAPEEVVRIDTPVGTTVGWEERPDSPEKGLVCAGGPVVGTACVPKGLVPRVPTVPTATP